MPAAARKITKKPRARSARRVLKVTAPRFYRVGDRVVREPGRGLVWTHTLGKFNYADAGKQIEKLNAEKFAGHADWRLPTVEELFCLADRTRSYPAIDTDAFPDTKSDWYWTSTNYQPVSGYAWVVFFDLGYSGSGHHGSVGFVRAVRASQ